MEETKKDFLDACKDENEEKVRNLFNKVDQSIQQEGLMICIESNEKKLISFMLEEMKMNPNNCFDSKGRGILAKLTSRSNFEMIELYFGMDGMLNILDSQQQSALHWSISTGNLKLVKFLVSLGIDFKLKNSLGESALTLAIEEEETEIIHFLKQVEKDPSKYWKTMSVEEVKENWKFRKLCKQKEKDFKSIHQLILNSNKSRSEQFLSIAVMENEISVVEFLLFEQNLNPNNSHDLYDQNFPILFMMCQYANREMIEMYLIKGGNLNVLNFENGENALFPVIELNEFEMVKYLISIGIDFHLKNKKGMTPLEFAEQEECEEIAQFLKDVEKEPTLFWNIAKFPTEETILFKKSCRKGEDLTSFYNLVKKVDQKTKEEGLGIAVLENNSPIIKYLLIEESVDPNIKDSEGSDLLFELAANGNIEMIELYLEKGGKLNVLNVESGTNPLHLAASFGELDACRLLVSRGIDFKLKDKDGKTAIDQAKSRNKIQVVDFLTKIQNQ